VVQVGLREDSSVYVRMKQKAAEEVRLKKHQKLGPC
jgi:5,10-methylene-tetrahydrofolate dehydrogenase/methenyl tetrahydrofolate cyclohydrolase